MHSPTISPAIYQFSRSIIYLLLPTRNQFVKACIALRSQLRENRETSIYKRKRKVIWGLLFRGENGKPNKTLSIILFFGFSHCFRLVFVWWLQAGVISSRIESSGTGNHWQHCLGIALGPTNSYWPPNYYLHSTNPRWVIPSCALPHIFFQTKPKKKQQKKEREQNTKTNQMESRKLNIKIN